MYERKLDKTNELLLAGRFADRWGLVPHESPPYCPVDGAFFKENRPLAFFECKTRSYNLSKLDSVWVDVEKVQKSLLAASRKGIKYFLLFSFDDGDFYCEVSNPGKWETRRAQNNKPRDGNDFDEVYCIPRSDWVAL